MQKKIILSRRLTKGAGFPFYYTGKPCIRGHFAERYTKTGHCVQCVRDRNRKRIRRD